MPAVEGSILEKMVQNASKNGQLQGRQLFRAFNSLGPDAKRAIWGNRLPQIQEFMQAAGSLQNVVLERIVNHYAPYAVGYGAALELGRGDVKGAGALAGTALLVGLLRNPIVLDAALKGIDAAKQVAVPAASAAANAGASAATDQDQQDEKQTPGTPISQNENTNGWVPITLSDGRRFTIHPDDLAEAQRRDPGLKTS